MNDRYGFPQLLKEAGLTGIGVELGSFKAEYAKFILKNWPGTLYLIDVWRGLDDAEYEDCSNHKLHSDIYAEAIKNLVGYEDRAYMLRAKGNQVVDIFKDNSLDFIYIDANHTYEAVKEDIIHWYPKVKSGGIVSGHDFLQLDCYTKENYAQGKKNFPIWMWQGNNQSESTYAGMFGVNPAVEEFCEKNQYTFNVSNDFPGTWWFIKR